MTEKRFIVLDCSTCVFDKIAKEEYVCIDKEEAFLVCDRFNKFVDENEQLKQFKEQVFNIINKKLQDNERLDGVDTAMYYANRQTLNELKKELGE